MTKLSILTYGRMILNHPCIKFFVLFCIFSFYSTIHAQSFVYDTFEGKKYVLYGARTGVLDTVMKNPSPDKVDSSAKCAYYVRNSSKKFDNIKMSVTGKMIGVKEYATYLGVPPQIRMKVYSTAPPGTLVEILLGSKGRNNEYPAGTHSQYQAYTTISNGWEELIFKFSQVPDGSETTAEQIDQITLLFNPNSSTSDTFYFDDITGPVMIDRPILTATPSKDNKK